MRGDQINMPSSETTVQNVYPLMVPATLNLFLSNYFKKHYMSLFKADDSWIYPI